MLGEETVGERKTHRPHSVGTAPGIGNVVHQARKTGKVPFCLSRATQKVTWPIKLHGDVMVIH